MFFHFNNIKKQTLRLGSYCFRL